MAISSVNPATGKLIRSFEPLSENEIEHRLELGASTFRTYRNTSLADRAASMRKAGTLLEKEKINLGMIMTAEMGKPLVAAVEEAVKCAWVCRYYAEHAERFLADEIIQTNASLSYISYQPLGPILAVMPWNFPFWQVFRFAAPALMAGNVGLLKHASNVPQCALTVENIFHRAGFSEGVFQTLLVGSDKVGKIVEDPRIKAVTLTGSESAGSQIASIAGKAIKKTVLELGGSDPFIVMPTADIDEASRTAVRARSVNNGESCIAAKRFIVHEKIYDEFTTRFVRGMKDLKVADPENPDCDIGPLATAGILKELDNQVQTSLQMGALLLTGGKRINRPGYFFEPTVLCEIPKNAPAYTEELFGPVASLFRIRDTGDAVRLANDTDFGLGASVWTNDESEKRQFISELESGLVFINGMVASDPRLPFGGVKKSGYGRELSSEGIRAFVNIKTVWIK